MNRNGHVLSRDLCHPDLYLLLYTSGIPLRQRLWQGKVVQGPKASGKRAGQESDNIVGGGWCRTRRCQLCTWRPLLLWRLCSPQALETAPEAITKPILAAIKQVKAYDGPHRPPGIQEYPDLSRSGQNIRGRITKAEDRIGTMGGSARYTSFPDPTSSPGT